jgi:hypothetical protein
VADEKAQAVRCQFVTDKRFKKDCEPSVCGWKLCEKRPEGGYLSQFKGDQYAVLTYLGAVKCPCCGNWTDIPPSPLVGVEKTEAKNAR